MFFYAYLLALDNCSPEGYYMYSQRIPLTITTHESAHKQRFYDNERISLLPDALPPD